MTTMIKLGVIMDPIGSINIKKDSTFAMLLEAQARDWEIYYMEMADLFFKTPAATLLCVNCKSKTMLRSGFL